MKNKKWYVSGIIGCLLLITAILFQNCSKVKFSGLQGANGIALSAKIHEIPVTGVATNSYENLNLVIILDDSASMAQEIEQVKVALDGFLKKLTPKQALTTSVYGINHLYLPQKFIKYDVDGNVLPDNAPVASVAKEKQIFSLQPPAAKLVTTPDTPASQFTAAKDKFFADVNAYLEQKAKERLFYPDVNETGLCTLTRYLHDEALSKGGDKVSFLVITDEDDFSSPTNCANYDFITYEPLARLDFKGATLTLDVEVSGTRASDGGLTNQVVREIRKSNYTCNKSINFCQTVVENADCTPEILAYFNQPYYYSLKTLTSIDSCKMTVKTGVSQLTYFHKSSTEDISTACTGPVKLKGSPTVYASFKDYLAYEFLNYVGPNPTCTMGVTRMSAGLGLTHYEEFKDIAVAPDRIRDFALSKYSDKNVAMNVVIYDKDDAGCAVVSGSNGSRYAQLVGSSNPSFKKHSICSAEYNAVLAETNNLINWSADRIYDLVLDAGYEVVGVEVFEQTGKKTMLTKDQYLLNGNKLTINIDALPMNSVINVYYDKSNKK